MIRIAELPDAMFICVCQGVTERDVRDCAQRGVASVAELREALGVTTGCGKCADAADEILRECAAQSSCATAAPA
jgi:bacterioferritin-associated ferredoxin